MAPKKGRKNVKQPKKKALQPKKIISQRPQPSSKIGLSEADLFLFRTRDAKRKFQSFGKRQLLLRRTVNLQFFENENI